MERIRVNDDGTIRLPKKYMKSLQLRARSYVNVDLDDGRITLERAEDYDPFAEPEKPADADFIAKGLVEDEKRAKEANRKFERMMEDPPEVRPEDRPEFWD